jgi:hypothetical protein
MMADLAAVFAYYAMKASGSVSSVLLSAAILGTLASRKNKALVAQSLGFAILFFAAVLVRLVL